MDSDDSTKVTESDDECTDDEVANEAIEDYLSSTPDINTLLASTSRATPSPSPQVLEDIELLKAAIEINLEISMKYKKLNIILARSLIEVRQKLQSISQAILKNTKCYENGFSYLRSGKPYFKDKNNFCPPDNEDTIMMRQAQMYDFSLVSSVPGWATRDKTELVNALLAASRDIRKRELQARIAQLNTEKSNESLLEKVKLQREITQLAKKSLTEVALPLDMEYDWEALSLSLNKRHTPQEYQALWKLFLHPSINKGNWNKAEHKQLQKIAVSFGMQNWDGIAKQLNTRRTGYQCFVYYRTNMAENNTNLRWTAEEIEYLQRVIDYFREGSYIPWGRVATAMDNRTKIQIYNKYIRLMSERKGRFLEEEDVVILNCIENQMPFQKIQEFLPGRSTGQLKIRYRLLTKLRLSQTWSVEDDKKLIQIMANQDSPSNFSAATEHFPGKDRMHIRSRYYTLMKWMKKHPATDVAMAPRRGARRLLHGHANMKLSDAVANLRKRMEEEVKAKKSKKITILSSEVDIEFGIMAALMNEIIKEESQKTSCQIDISNLSNLSLEIPEDTSYSQNLINLHKILIMMNSALDENKMKESKYATIYQGWGEIAPEASLLKVKSYSRVDSVKTIDMGDIPDVWGNIILGTTSYVLPPNYATITGCRTLLSLMEEGQTAERNDEINLSLMARRNEYLRDGLRTLKERFTLLFLWPVVLSNEGPPPIIKNEPYVSRLKPTEKLWVPEKFVINTSEPPLKKYKSNCEARQIEKKSEPSHPLYIDHDYVIKNTTVTNSDTTENHINIASSSKDKPSLVRDTIVNPCISPALFD